MLLSTETILTKEIKQSTASVAFCPIATGLRPGNVYQGHLQNDWTRPG